MDEILCTHHNAYNVQQHLPKSIPFKQELGNPEMYLGVKLHNTRFHNGIWAWALSLVKYAQEAVRYCATHSKANYDGDVKLSKKQKIHLRCVIIQSWTLLYNLNQMWHLISRQSSAS